jgi:RHS repeat-associated protein
MSGTVTKTFDTRFRESAVTVNGGPATSYQYDDDDRLISAEGMTIAYEAGTNRVESTTLGVVIDTYTYDEFGDLESHTAVANGITVFATDYQRDALGRITTIEEGSETKTYTYDSRNRLATATDDDGTRTYTYDPNGNRLARTEGASTEVGTYDGDDRVLTYDGKTYEHTPTGEIASRTDGSATDEFTYDRSGALRSFGPASGPEVSYEVDGSGRRVARNLDGTRDRSWLYQDQLRLAAELTPSGSVRQRYAYAFGTTPSVIAESNRTVRVITDHLGSPRAVVDSATGAVVDTAEFDEFGRDIDRPDPANLPVGYTGGLTDRESGLVRLGARDYSPAEGRWTSRDPLGIAGGQLNLAAYLNSDPVNAIDPSGLCGIGATEPFGSSLDSDWGWAAAGFATGFSATTVGAGIGAAVGFSFGGPLGAMAGAAVGLAIAEAVTSSGEGWAAANGIPTGADSYWGFGWGAGAAVGTIASAGVGSYAASSPAGAAYKYVLGL